MTELGDRPDTPTITVEHNGPLHVSGRVAVNDHLGEPLDLGAAPVLCRCGGSATRPRCDGSHRRLGFDDAKDPDRLPDQVGTARGVTLDVADNRSLCAHSGRCTDLVPGAFHADSEPFATPNGARADDLIAAARRCPSGAISVSIDGRVPRAVVDTERPAEIVVSRDGPYWVRGSLAIVTDSGAPVARNAGASPEHAALCRCGRSRNKPFCSGRHWDVNFSDPQPADRPSVYEYLGGRRPLVEMLELFYGKYVPEDEILRPVFLGMSPDHPERVGAWLGEVFGGPRTYSEQMGGYTAMIAHHLGRCLTEQQRRRWLELMLVAADEVGLSDNPELRAAFTSYLEWGTRLAVENSRTDATPPPNMPMPRWDWTTAAGPPWSRQPASAPVAEDHRPELPGPDGPVAFEPHVRSLFRQRDRDAMEWAFDLWSCADVRRHVDHILDRVGNGTMPPDAPWPTAWVDVLRRWADSEMPERPDGD